MSNASILVVEDDNIVAMELKQILDDMGYRVIDTASNAEKAIRIAGEQKPDLILMDIRLKGPMDGVEAARVIVSKYGIPLIYLTGLTDKGTIRRAKETGAFCIIMKPFAENDLIGKIRAALKKNNSILN